MNPSEINLDNVKIEDNYVNYEGNRLKIQTDWISTYFIKKFKTLKVSINKEADLLKILKHIDKEIFEYLPDKCIQSVMVKKFEETEYVLPKYEYASVFDENKKETTIKALEKENIECRFIFTVTPIKRFQNYYGTHLKCLQIQVRDKHIDKSPCMFD